MSKDNHASKMSPSLGFLVVVYFCLLVLLGLTIILAHFTLGDLALAVALLIAAAKATLVVLYFMHVRYGSRVTWLFVTAGIMWLAILFGLTYTDYAGRSRLNRAQPLPLSTSH